MLRNKKLKIELFDLKAELVQTKHDLEREVDRCEGLYERLFEQERETEKLERKKDKINELLEELKYNQNINLSQELENRVNIDYIIERLSDCLGEENDK